MAEDDEQSFYAKTVIKIVYKERWRVISRTRSYFLFPRLLRRAFSVIFIFLPSLLIGQFQQKWTGISKIRSGNSQNPPFKASCKRLLLFVCLPEPALSVSLRSAPMDSVQMEELTSGASGRIIPVFRNLRRSVFSWQSIRRSLIFIHSIFLWLLLLLPRHRLSSSAQSPPAPVKSCRRRSVFRRDEEDTQRRRALAEGLEMVTESRDETSLCRCDTFLFYGTRRNALFCRSWFPVSGELK